MLNRTVMISGYLYDSHELRLATFDPGVNIVCVVLSKSSTYEYIETTHVLPFVDGMKIEDIEAALWALPEFQEYRNFESELNTVLDMLTDEQAQEVTALYPEWQFGTHYVANDRVRYNNTLYKCIQDNLGQTGWEPSNAPALWVKVAPEGTIPDWVQPTGAQDAYAKGDKVIHKEKTWTSTVDDNVWEPGVYGWAIVN